ncbi:MAG: phosphodiester glycosidase family protein [Actinomycetota bacterium]
MPRKAFVLGLGLAVVGSALAAAPLSATPITVRYPFDRQLKLVTTREPDVPLEVRKLVISPGFKAVPDIAPAAIHYPMYALTSRISQGAGALFGVNGDYGTPLRQPVHDLMIDGELWTTGQTQGNAAAWSEDGRTAYIGRPRLRIRALSTSKASLFDIKEWNAHLPTTSTVAGYTSRGGIVTVPPGVASPSQQDPVWCEARLEPTSGLRWSGAARTSIVRTYSVTTQPDPCQGTSLPVGTTPGAVVLASEYASSVSNAVKNLSVGQSVKLTWTFAGWPGVTDVMGGGQMLVDQGVNIAPPYVSGSPHVLDYNPRTAIGIKRGCSDLKRKTECKMYLETVDGRQASTNWSVGVRLPWLADSLIQSGAWMALNLDGGGSETMWTSQTNSAYCQVFPAVGGCLVQRPSQTTGERAVRSAIVVLPSADTGAPTKLR